MNVKTRLVALLAVLAPAVAWGTEAGLARTALHVALAAAPKAGTVFTTEGGRMKGTVLEAGPAGVTVQLADGSTRKLEAAQVTKIDFSDGTTWTPQAAAAPAAAAGAAAPAAAAGAPAAAATGSPAAAAPAATGAVAGAATGAAVGAAAAAPHAAPNGAPVAKPIAIPVDKLDTVYLANGGKVRGLVVEEGSADGVVMRLVDGTERRFKPGEALLVQYANGTVSAQPKATPPAAK